MLLHLYNYNTTIKYCPGKEMLVADALFHYAPPDAPEIPFNIFINQVHITLQMTEFQLSIINDPLLHSLADTIFTGWPEDINGVPHPLCLNYAHCDISTVEDGLILHGEALIISPTEIEKALQAIHEGYLGIT